MSDPRYPGVTDAEGTRAADGGYEARDAGRGSESSRARYSDPYGTPAGSAGGSGSAADKGVGGSRGSAGYGYPAGSEQGYGGRPRSDSGGRSSYGSEYGDNSGRGYGGAASGAGPSGYPSSGYSAPTTYEASGRKTTYDASGGKSTYDTRSSSASPGGPAGRSAGGYSSPAARVASAMRRSMSSAAHGPRRARLQLKHIDPWSTLKFSLVLAVALFVVWMVAIGVLYGVLDGMGVFDKINGLYEDVTGKSGEQIVGPGLVLGIAALIGAINIVLFTALATVGSFIYNMCADLVGGVEITLSEHD